MQRDRSKRHGVQGETGESIGRGVEPGQGKDREFEEGNQRTAGKLPGCETLVRKAGS